MTQDEAVRDRAADAADIARLTTLDPMEYDREREAAAKALGIRVGTLDQMVQAARPAPEVEGAGRGVALQEVEPWPVPVVAGALLDDLAEAIRRHVVMSQAATDCAALWIAHTWVFDRFQHTPRAAVRSPAKRCGKSTLLDVFRATCARPLKADNISASGVFRTVETLRPTLLLDEADAYLGDNDELRGVLNSGFERSGEVVRVMEVKGVLEPVRFRTCCPVALAGIGELPGTLEDRAVPLVLQRKAAGETVVKLRAPGARATLHTLARKLGRWAADRGPHLPQDPPIPDALGDREGDIAVPLLAIADNAGGDWPERARMALMEVFGVRAAAEGTMETGALLLRDIKVIFAEMSALRMPSADIVARLAQLEDRPWPEWRHGKPMTAPQLARALAPFGVRSAVLRIGGDVARGYYREAFEEAWERYLPPETPAPPPVKPLQRNIADADTDLLKLQPVTPTAALRVENRENPSPDNKSNGVTAPWEDSGAGEAFDEVDAWIAGGGGR